jgi:hypothetical protein
VLFAETIENEAQARLVVEQATRALKTASEFYRRQATALEGERARLEERIRQAERVIELEKSVAEAMGSPDSDD